MVGAQLHQHLVDRELARAVEDLLGRAVAVFGSEVDVHGVGLIAEYVDPARGVYRFRPVTEAQDAAISAAELLKLASGGSA